MKESLELLSAVLSREIPESFIAKKFLPEVGVCTNLTFSFRAAMKLVEVHILRQLVFGGLRLLKYFKGRVLQNMLTNGRVQRRVCHVVPPPRN